MPQAHGRSVEAHRQAVVECAFSIEFTALTGSAPLCRQ
ncbi:MAG: hypothetical protein ACJA1L_001853, partial [Paracoccaceae bacterium]